MDNIVFSREQQNAIDRCKSICKKYQKELEGQVFRNPLKREEKEEITFLVSTVYELYKKFNIPVISDLEQSEECLEYLKNKESDNLHSKSILLVGSIGFIINGVDNSIKYLETGRTDKCQDFRMGMRYPVDKEPAGVRVSRNRRQGQILESSTTEWTQGE